LQACLAAGGAFLLFPATAHAYLDPGTGSLLLSALIGIIATAFFMIKNFFYKAAGLVYRLRGVAAPARDRNAIVFYSEGRQYWNTFKTTLEALDGAGEPALYLTSDKNDPGLEHPFSQVQARYIGQGGRAFAAMNLLEAGVCVMTTPGLDVLQIRRSRQVRHYAHLVHAPTDISFYRLFSFDYFDSVLCSGPHQIRSLRALERLRGTKPKELLATGCPYMDVLAGELPGGKNNAQAEHGGERPWRVLLAPTWGPNGLLRRFGAGLLEPMLEAGFRVTVRPHPQSRTSEPELLEELAALFRENANLAWDHSTSPLPAMLESDVLVSDLSGIVFDYAFILERPVLTVSLRPDQRGYEAGDLPWPAWELAVLPSLGAVVAPEEIGKLPETLRRLPAPDEFARRMAGLRAESLFNYGAAGAVAARQILEIRDRLRAGEAAA
jgi:hypothetical protein